MKVVRCANGHFYDAEKSSSCPYCTTLNDSSAMDFGFDEDDGSSGDLYSSRVGAGEAKPEIGPAASARAGRSAGNSDTEKVPQAPTAGWLVCISGTNRGKSFPICVGKNFVGRSERLDIYLGGDDAVSEEIHAIITYEPRQRQFFVQPGSSHSLVYVNDQVVLNNITLNDHDKLMVGNTTLVFVPFCGETFNWEE